MVRFGQFSTKSLFRTIAIWSILLAIVSGVIHWQMYGLQLHQAGRVLYLRGGAVWYLRPMDRYRMEPDEWKKKWESKASFLRGNPVAMLDLSVNAPARKEAEQIGSVVVPPFDDDAINDLAAYKHLEAINLRGAHLTDEGLPRLLQFKKLVEIDLSGTKVTQAGIDKFLLSRPGCEIINEADWKGKRSPLAYNYWKQLKLGIIDEEGNFLRDP